MPKGDGAGALIVSSTLINSQKRITILQITIPPSEGGHSLGGITRGKTPSHENDGEDYMMKKQVADDGRLKIMNGEV